MHFLRATIFSIAALAFMASAQICAESCLYDEDCGGPCHCVGVSGDVSSLLLLSRFKLTCNHFTGPWALRNRLQ